MGLVVFLWMTGWVDWHVVSVSQGWMLCVLGVVFWGKGE